MRRRGTNLHVRMRGSGVFPLDQAVRLAPVAVAPLGPVVHKRDGRSMGSGVTSSPVALDTGVSLSFSRFIESMY